MSTIRVVNIQHTDATEPNIVLEADGTTVFASGITISGGTNLTVSGTAEFASGTVSAPSITFIDDNNTGIYEPAADTVAITTAATERVRVDSAGNIGIGTASPNNYANYSTLTLNNTTGSIIDFEANGTIYGELQALANEFRINAVGASGVLKMYAGASERLRIDSSGNVGIGKTSSGNKLEIEGQGNTKVVIDGRTDAANGSDAILELWSKNSGGTNNFGFVDFDGDGNFEIGIGGSGAGSIPLVFKTNSSEHMRIDSAGRLLVGTTSASSGRCAVFQGHSGAASGQAIVSFGCDSTAPGNGGTISSLRFCDGNQNDGAIIDVIRDGGTWTSGSSQPSAILFKTAANGSASPSEQLKINSIGRMSGQAVNVQKAFNLLYARLKTHSGCISGGPSATFTEFDTGEAAFVVVGRTVTTAPTNYVFFGDNYGSAFTLFVGCGDNPVFSTSSAASNAATYRSWVCIHSSFVGAIAGLPTNATRTSLP